MVTVQMLATDRSSLQQEQAQANPTLHFGLNPL
jgi:hypothetical protein